MRTSITKAGLIVCVFVLLTGFAQAGNTYWTGGTDNWSIGSNWNPAEPGWDDYAFINNGGTAQVTSSNYEYTRGIHLGENAGDEGTIDISGGTVYVTTYFYLGDSGKGALNITAGELSCNYCYVGTDYDSIGEVTVDGPTASFETYVELRVGHAGSGTLDIMNGAVASCMDGSISFYDVPSEGAVTVDGPGSTWTNRRNLRVGTGGAGTLTITNGGLVSVGGILVIDSYRNDNSFINIAAGGILALKGEGDDSINDFLGLLSQYEGKDSIQYRTVSGWDHITNATEGVDYNLQYLDTGDLTGYTLLTVTAVPEPSIFAMLVAGFGGLLLTFRRKI